MQRRLNVAALVSNVLSQLRIETSFEGGFEHPAESRVLASELGPKRIRVNPVVPGTLNTPLLQRH